MMASFYVKYNNLFDKTIKYLGSPKKVTEKWIDHFVLLMAFYTLSYQLVYI